MQAEIATSLDQNTKLEITQNIIRILDEQAKGWNAGDATIYSNAFDSDGCFTNIFGMFLKGYPEFLKKHNMILQNVFKGSAFSYQLVHLHILNEQVVTADTLITISGFNKSGAFNMIYTDEKGNLVTRLLQVFLKRKNEWRVVNYHNVDIKSGISIPELDAS